MRGGETDVVSVERPEPAPVVIRLYEPVTPPAVPRKAIGRVSISMDLWEQIGGVGRRYADGRRGDFQLRLAEPLPEIVDMSAAMTDTVTIETIRCEVVRLWRDGGDTFEWRAVVPDPGDREKIAAKTGVWRG